MLAARTVKESGLAEHGDSSRSELRIEKPHAIRTGLSTRVFDVLLAAFLRESFKGKKRVARWFSF